jgi:hypothetical protein
MPSGSVACAAGGAAGRMTQGSNNAAARNVRRLMQALLSDSLLPDLDPRAAPRGCGGGIGEELHAIAIIKAGVLG